ncbi:MAG: hypothetical protein NVSMB65_04490 [Chloroflexota bacterium]
MSERAQQLAERFEQANGEAIAVVERLSDEQWSASCAGEGWPVGVVAHHIAASHAVLASRLRQFATGEGFTPRDMEAINQRNAVHAEQHATCTKPETLDLLRDGGAAVAAVVRSLDDDQLQHSAVWRAGVPPISVAQAIERIVIGHVLGHLESMRQTVGAP